ncbi:saccharopine dehydrogenase NADP-binding domain-containing protein [Paucibacter sp. APW11]|uniref:Saccharopine dehydrogenase NADP-binding domain-containing protein n=1 Tax=Roseateles aquae TaxID=3077235 RepID=A0ABU3PE35_9BURK|nr:saccharopine dehydrogenase NADP-binding domain-containing protein [Paucibacter sp. APW11]MDT9000829.1 saccharopine dehydrogenase NADP-binding domain-containing protein [Paucibacter sp. APW11]
MKLLVLGGYGNFGARICRALAAELGPSLLVGGRDAARAEAFATSLGHGAQGLAIDHSQPGLDQRLRQAGVGLLIHTAGPFQAQGYAVAEAAAAAGAHYIDLADGRRFVCDFGPALEARFRAAGRVAISGASTVPALSSAVVDALSAGWQRLDEIDICIAPAQSAPRGEATLAAVLSYCGAPIRVWRGGRWVELPGWAAPAPVHFQRLRPRLGALCDIPDLELLPAHYAGVQTVMFRAALEVPLSQRAFAWLAALRRAGLLRRPERLARLLHRGAPLFDAMGSALGGMVLRVRGQDARGAPAARAWHIAADDDHGPEIPCMAAILLARKLWRGEPLPAGARACTSLLRLDEFAPEFRRWGMVCDIVDEAIEGSR